MKLCCQIKSNILTYKNKSVELCFVWLWNHTKKRYMTIKHDINSSHTVSILFVSRLPQPRVLSDNAMSRPGLRL